MKMHKFLKDCPKPLQDHLNEMHISPEILLKEEIGGGCFEIESEGELAQISTVNGKSLLESEDIFDVLVELEGGYYLIALVTSDIGGDAYLVPPELVNDNIRNSSEVQMSVSLGIQYHNNPG